MTQQTHTQMEMETNDMDEYTFVLIEITQAHRKIDKKKTATHRNTVGWRFQTLHCLPGLNYRDNDRDNE